MKKFLLLTTSILTLSVASAQVLDGGFEAGAFGGTWTEASTNFGTPICDLASCGDCGGGCVPASGTFYSWFGGANAVETGSVVQSITIPTGTAAAISMMVKIPTPGPGLAADRLEIKLDGTILATVTAQDSAAYTEYTQLLVDVSSAANGASHSLSIEGFQTTATGWNVLVDDVVLTVDGAVIGLFEFEKEENVTVYPNPANKEINLNFGKLEGAASISIISVDGAVVAQHEVNDVLGKTVTFNTSDLNNGVYMVQIVNNGNVSTERIVISK